MFILEFSTYKKARIGFTYSAKGSPKARLPTSSHSFFLAAKTSDSSIVVEEGCGINFHLPFNIVPAPGFWKNRSIREQDAGIARKGIVTGALRWWQKQ